MNSEWLKYRNVTIFHFSILLLFLFPADIPGRLQNGANVGWMCFSANKTEEGEIRQDYVVEESRTGKCIAFKFPLTRHPISAPSGTKKVMCRRACSPEIS